MVNNLFDQAKLVSKFATAVLLAGLCFTYAVPGAFANDSTNATKAKVNEILGAGASFPAPVYSKWATTYRDKTSILVNYQSIGSGGGVKQIEKGLVHFGASDYPLKDQELQEFNLYQFPTLGGGIVISVNLRELNDKLVLDGPTIADIYRGVITKWNDERIKKLNPSIADQLPDIYIAVLFRSDGSGTTYNFTKYLAEVSPEFDKQLGYGKAINFPVGLGGKGNEGVAAVLPRVYGSIGYIEYGYAKSLNLGLVSMINKQGVAIKPTLESFAVALSNADWKSATPNVSNIDNPQAWPINSLTYILVNKSNKNVNDIKAFFKYGMIDSTKLTYELDYVPLDVKISTQLLNNFPTSK